MGVDGAIGKRGVAREKIPTVKRLVARNFLA